MSDFLEDDGIYRFVTARELASPERARQLGAQLRELRGFKMRPVPLCPGRPESTDFVALSLQRREAIDTFWTTYLAAGSEYAGIQLDGTGMLANADRGCSEKNP